MEPPGVTPPMTFSGRAVSQEMGQVRLGGSGRPVAISTRSGDAPQDGDGPGAVERRQPRVVLEPQPRSPFGRKLETSVSASLISVESQARRPQAQKTTAVPHERVHTTHHATHRTPIAVALRRADAPTPGVESSADSRDSSRKRAAIIDPENGTDRKRASARAPKKVGWTAAAEATATHTGPPQKPVSSNANRISGLKPEHIALFTRKPDPTDAYDTDGHSFHTHERLSHVVSHDDSSHDGAIYETEDPSSGWRAVDDSIDHIYEDPSIDVVQQQLLLHAKIRSGEKRKAVERERLQAAAAEVQKQREGQNLKLVEFQHRREQIMKMSNDIRARNKVTRQAPSASSSLPASGKKKIQDASTMPTRKPPVPRLSQLGGKPKAAKYKAKANSMDMRRVGDTTDNLEQTPTLAHSDRSVYHDTSKQEDQSATHSDSRASESILSSRNHPKSGERSNGARRATKKHKLNNPHVPHSQQTEHRSPPMEEKLQRRAVAREYMQIQKQARQLMQAKMRQQQQLEEERRRLELQRLEQTRLVELEEARKRRIRQKQRERIAQRKRDEQEKQFSQDQVRRSPHSALSTVTSGARNSIDDNDAKGSENQSLRGNRTGPGQLGADTFDWPDSDHDSSRASSPRFAHESGGQEKDLRSAAEGGPKLQKLLALEEQTKMLAQKLQLLSRQNQLDEESSHANAEPERRGGIDRDMVSENESIVDGEDDGSESDGSECSDSDGDGHISDRHSTTRVDHEDFVYFDGGFHRSDDLDMELDFSSIGVQKIQVVWPPDDQSDEVHEELSSSRFEILPSSSSSSSASESDVQTKLGRNVGSASPKLLEDSVDSYAQRLFDMSVRAQTSKSDEFTENTIAREWEGEDRHNPPTRVRSKTSPLKRKQQSMSSDAELLRLIRESDDNLSVIDREAKRRFRLQQDRLRQRQQDLQRQEQERIQAMLSVRDCSPEPHQDLDLRARAEEQDSQVADSECSGDTQGQLEGVVKIDQILEAVRTESSTLGNDSQHTQVVTGERSEQPDQPTPSIAFWNSQLRPVQTDDVSRPHPKVHVEVDRSDINAQRERQRELEDDEDDAFDRPRLLSPQTLAKRLIAAVEYHEVIHDAHLQLSIMERDHALEQVQQDTLALAQAFKEELDGNLLAQQLVDDHAALEVEFDKNLKDVADQLETVREAEHRENEIVRRQLEEEARAAKRREFAVQTEPPHHVDVSTSARLRVDVASTTDAERHDAAVQHTVDSSVHLVHHQKGEEEEESEPLGDYDEETFDRSEPSSPLNKAQPADKRSGEPASVAYTDDSVKEESHELLRGGDVRRAAFDEDRDVSDGEVESEVDVEIEEDAESEDIQSESMQFDDQSITDNGGLVSGAGSPQRESASASVAYDDDDFEEDASLAHVKPELSVQNVEIASEDEVYESEEDIPPVSRPQSESASVGYEDEDFEHEACAAKDSSPTELPDETSQPNEEFVDSSVSAVTSEYGDKYDDIQEDDHSIIDEHSSEASDRYATTQRVEASVDNLPANPTPSSRCDDQMSAAKAVELTSTSPFIVSIDAPRIARTAPVDPEIAQAYLQQLENRKTSEEALLDIRLRALESKLQQDLQRIADEIRENECTRPHDDSTRVELELRKDAMQMMYLSEKANVESQKSASVSRYYQDLLAFRAIGVAAPLVPTLPSASTRTTHLHPTSESSLPGPVPAFVSAVEPAKADDSESDVYDEDEFVASKVLSDGEVDDSQSNVEPQYNESDTSTQIANAPKDEVDEVQDDISSKASAIGEEELEDAISSAPESYNDQDYADENFASVSEMAADVEEHNGDSKESSIRSTNSVGEDQVSVVEAAADEASIVYEDEFTAPSEDGAALEEPNSVGEIDEDATGKGDAPSSAAESEQDEVGEAYDDEEFGSVSESALNVASVSVPDDDLDKVGDIADENDKSVTSAVDDMDNAYDDEFASVSEPVAAPEKSDSVSEDDIHEDNDGTEHAPSESEDDAPQHDRSKSDDNYADDDFEESEATPTYADDTASPTGGPPVIHAVEGADDEGEEYSDEDFEGNDSRSSRSSSTETPKVNETNSSGPGVVLDASEIAGIASDEAVDYMEPSYELPSAKSLSATELSNATANNSQEFNPDSAAMTIALAESISVSHQEEDLTTASMEEQLRRIDDLRRQIDLRKEAFAAVQKKMRVEKKKENLREAEAQLWVEMEQLESQLVADERILELTRQRGRLESMELEAKHSRLQLRGADLQDLLADFDYCEPVEPVKPVIVKQDGEAQVRFADHQPTGLPSRSLVDHTEGRWDQDLLLAFDHVELAERPVTTIATNTDTVKPHDDELTKRNEILTILQPDPVSTDVDDTNGRTGSDLPPTLQSPLSPDLEDASQPMLASCDQSFVNEQKSEEDVPIDLLAGYHHIEVAQEPEVMLDLLHGYDHVELVETCAVLTTVELSIPVNPPIMATREPVSTREESTAHDNLTDKQGDSVDSDDAFFDESFEDGDKNVNENESDNDNGRMTQVESAQRAQSDELDGDIPDEASPLELHRVNVTQERPAEERTPSEDSVRNEEGSCQISGSFEHNEDMNDADAAPHADLLGDKTPSFDANEELVQRITADLLASMLRGALIDIRSQSVRKSLREHVSTTIENTHDDSVHSPSYYGSPTARHPILDGDDNLGDRGGEALEGPSSPPINAEVESPDPDGDLQGAESEGEDSLVASAEQIDGHREQDADAMVERVFADLVAVAVQDGVRLEQSKMRCFAPDPSRGIALGVDSPKVVSDKGVRVDPLHPDRKMESAILLCLRIEPDRVTLPPFHQCVPDQRGASNARVIYDAALETASHVYQQLCQDPLFRDEREATKKQHLLVERVKCEMEESIWSCRERTRDELDRFGRKMLEEEQGELDQDDLRLLLAQQRGGASHSMVSLFQTVALRSQLASSPSGAVITPRLRRRASSSSSIQASNPGLAARILHEEEARLAGRITDRLMRDLVRSETAERRTATDQHRRS